MMTAPPADRPTGQPSTSQPSTGQQLLQLWLYNPDLGSSVMAWSYYDGSSAQSTHDDLPEKPPYPSALHAMRDGWRVLSIAPAGPSVPGHEFRTSFLPNEVVLERFREPAHV